MTDNLPAVRTEATPALNSGFGTLVPRNMTEAMETAKMLHASGWFKDLKDAGQALTKIVLGAEMGVSPITAVRGIYVLETQRGPVITLSGDLEAKLMKAAGYDWTIDQLDDQACRLTIFKGPRELGQVSFTIEQARKARLTNKAGPWQDYTSDMLFARAIVRARRRFAPEVTGGLPMPVMEAEEVAQERASDDQMKALRVAVFSRWPESVDEPHRTDRLAFLGQVIGRDILTISGDHDLSRGEVTALLDHIATLPGDTNLPDSGHSAPASSEPPGATPLQNSAGPYEGASPQNVQAQAASPAEHHPQSSREAGTIPSRDIGAEAHAGASLEPQSEPTGGNAATQDMTGAASGGLGEVTPTPSGLTSDTMPSGSPKRGQRDGSPTRAPSRPEVRTADVDGPAPAAEKAGPDEGPARAARGTVGAPGAPAAPSRRRATTPQQEAFRKAQQDKRQTIDHDPSDPLHFIPSPTFRQLYVQWFENQADGDWTKGMEDARRHCGAHLERLRAEGQMGDEFSKSQLEAMARETFEARP